MTVTAYTNNQFNNQVAPGSKGYNVRVFLTPEQQTRLAEAVAREKEYLAKLKQVNGGHFPAPTAWSVLFEAFSYMSNECLDALLADVITRIGEDMKELPK